MGVGAQKLLVKDGNGFRRVGKVLASMYAGSSKSPETSRHT